MIILYKTATCAEQGYTSHACSACGDEYRDGFTALADHTMGDWTVTKTAACTEKGEESRACTVCTHTETRAIDAAGHTHTAETTAPSCKTEGYTTYTCACGERSYTTHTCDSCGNVYTDNFVDVKDHEYEGGNCVYCGLTHSDYFTFTLLSDGTYSIKMKNKNDMPSKILLPAAYNGAAVTTLAYSAFSNCNLITEVTLPDSITTMDSYAFYGCTALEKITLSENLTAISDYAFCSARALATVTIPASVRRIGQRTFTEGIVSIGESVFNGCSKLASIKLPDTLTSMGAYAFNNCSVLTEIRFETAEGWWYTTSSTATSGTAIDEVILSVPASAATAMVTTYKGCYLRRS